MIQVPDRGTAVTGGSPPRLGRSWLYVPASRGRMLEKAPGLPADVILVDLEDAVPPGDKGAARKRILRARERWSAESRRWMLRINGAASRWRSADLDLAESLRPEGVLLPKVEDPREVAAVADRMAQHGLGVAVMIETAMGVGRAREIAGAHPAVRTLVYGSADLRLSLGARPGQDRVWELHALQEVLLAARMYGCEAVDSVYFRFRDLDGLRRDARFARELGYDGKTCIHPGQVAVLHEVFSADGEEVAWAVRVLEAWERDHGAGRGVIEVDGEMIEDLHLTVARRILAHRPGS
jgi:(3S)-malyl-CoA thioesterase